MYLLQVTLHVKPEFLEAFRIATVENARNSVQEPGILRFDFFQQQDDPTRFLLIEIYRTPEDQELHRQTAHYAAWRDTVAEMMVEPRVATKYNIVFPGENNWK